LGNVKVDAWKQMEAKRFFGSLIQEGILAMKPRSASAPLSGGSHPIFKRAEGVKVPVKIMGLLLIRNDSIEPRMNTDETRIKKGLAAIGE